MIIFAALLFVLVPATAKADEHDHSGWTAWSSSTTLPSANGSYYLTKSVNLTETYILGTGKKINLCLNGHDITQTSSGNRVILIQGSAELNIYDCSGTPGKITGANITNSSMNGAGIFVNGTATLNMYGGEITGNSSVAGGGGAGIGGGTFNMYGGKITGNLAVNGGGLYVRASARSAFNMYAGEISGNTASSSGGAIAVDANAVNASINIFGGNISDNAAATGGGAYLRAVTFSMTGGEISDNTASSYGGGIRTAGNAIVNISGASITGNSGLRGGGISIEATGDKVTLNNVSINENKATGTADRGGGGIYVNVNQSLVLSGIINITQNTLAGNPSNLTVGYNRTAIESSLSSESVIGVSNYPDDYKNVISSVTVENLDCYIADSSEKRPRYTTNSLLELVSSIEHANTSGYTACSHGTAEWKAWSRSDSIPSESGFYYLTRDINLTTTQIRDEGNSITICLNGHNITQTWTATPRRLINISNGTELHICDCTATTLNGIYRAGKLTGGKASASASTGAILVNGASLYLHDGRICGNSSEGNAGAIVVSGGGSFVMSGGAITENTAATNGGGVYVSSGTFTMTGGKITQNGAALGGGVYVAASGSANITGGYIGENTAEKGSNIFADTIAGQGEFGIVRLANADLVSGRSGDMDQRPIWSRGFIFIDDVLTTGGEKVYQERTAARLESVQGIVTDTLTARLVARIAPKSGETVTLYYNNGIRTVTAKGSTISAAEGLFTYDASVNVNHIATPLDLTFKSGSVTISKKADYTILDYLGALSQLTGDNGLSSAQKTFTANLVVLADCLQQYADGIGLENPGTAIGTLPVWVTQNMTAGACSVNNKKVTFLPDSSDRILRAALNITDRINLFFKFNKQSTGMVAVKKNGYLLTEGTDYILSGNTVTITRLSPRDYSAVYTVSIISEDGKTTLCSADYSVYSYCTAQAGHSSGIVRNLVSAIYNYGASSAGIDEELIALYTASDLEKLRTNPSAGYILEADIDLEGADWKPVDFYGVLNGNGKTISGFNIATANSESAQGFFGTLSEFARVTGLTLKEFSITAAGGVDYAGGIAGINKGIIENCTVGADAKSALVSTGRRYEVIGECDASSIAVSGSTTAAGAICGKNTGSITGVCSYLTLYTDKQGLCGENSGTVRGLYRDTSKSSEKLSQTAKDMRQTIVDHMAAMGSIEWIPVKNMYFTSAYSGTVTTYEAGVVQYGLPYTQKYGSLERMQYCLTEDGHVQSWLPSYSDAAAEAYGSEVAPWDVYLGNDCSGAVYWSWTKVCSSVSFGVTGQMVPAAENLRYGVLALGGYQASSTITLDVIAENTPEVMAECLALLQYGDAIVQKDPDAGHAKLAARDAMVMRDENGVINLDASYLVTHEHGVGKGSSGKNSTWQLNGKNTFRALLTDGYIPLTCSELLNGEPAEASITPSGITGPFTGNVRSNYRIISSTMEMVNAATGKSYESVNFTALDTDRFKDGPSDGHARTTVRTVYPSAHEADFADLPSGDYNYSLKVLLSNGKSYTVKIGTYTKG